MYRRNRRLVCFDMDSTLIQTEVIDELAELAGVGASSCHYRSSDEWRNRF
jgi:phosphoserine phosphatase